MKGPTTKQTSNETATTTPNLWPGVQPLVENYLGRAGDLMANAGGDFVPGVNDIQSKAFQTTNNFANPSNEAYGRMEGIANNVLANRAPSLNLNPMFAGMPGNYAPGQIGGATQAAMPGNYAPGQLGGPAMVSAPQGYAPAQVGNIAAPNVAQASMARMPGFQSASNSALSNFGGAGGATGASVLDNLQAYFNPATAYLRDTAMQAFDDDAGRRQAEYAAQGARNGAFGGSRYAIGEAQLERDLSLARGQQDAQLLSNAWNAATGLASGDADRFTNASIASGQMATDANIAALNAENALNLANANNFNDYNMNGFNALNEMGMFNAGQYNDLASQVYGQQSQNQQFNAGSVNDMLAQQYGVQADMAGRNADAANQFSLAQFGANNDYGLARMGMEGDLAQFNAGQDNAFRQAQFGADTDYGMARMGIEADNSRFNAGQANDMQQFAAGYGLDAYGQNVANQLAGAGLFGDIQQQRGMMNIANSQQLADLGGKLWDIQNAQAMGPYAQLGLMGGLLDPLYALNGQTINTSGTSTSKTSGGLLGQILGGAFGLGAAALGG